MANKTIKFVTIKHKIYSYSCDTNASYDSACSAMYNCCLRIVAELKDKYRMFTFAKDIKVLSGGDQDDDRFDYVYLSVPEADSGMARGRLHSSTGDGGRGWHLSVDAEVESTSDVEYTQHKKSMRPGQLAYANNPKVSSVRINNVDGYQYDFGPTTDCCGRHVVRGRKHCIINRSGVSTKLLAAMSAYGLNVAEVKSKLPKDAVKDDICNYISVWFNDKNRANLMRLARTMPSVLEFRDDNEKISIPDADKSDFVKAIYSALDKAKKAKA